MLGCEGRLLGSWRGRRPVKCEPNNNEHHHQHLHHHVCYIIVIISSSWSSWITHPASDIESLDRSVRNSHALRWRLGVHLGRTIIMISLCCLSLLSYHILLILLLSSMRMIITSDMIVQIWKIHWITASLAPDTWFTKTAVAVMWLDNVQYMSIVQCTGAYISYMHLFIL